MITGGPELLVVSTILVCISSVDTIGATGLSGNLKFKNGYCSSLDFGFDSDVFDELSRV